jgi:hypothetical protein
MKPEGARIIIDTARLCSIEPADTFLNKSRFKFLEEYYPWPFVVRETFSMIQGDATGEGYNNTIHMKNNIDIWTYESINPDENISNND